MFPSIELKCMHMIKDVVLQVRRIERSAFEIDFSNGGVLCFGTFFGL